MLSYGQNQKVKPIEKVELGLVFSPDYCYRTLITDSEYQWFADFSDSLGLPMFGFTSGVTSFYKISKRLAFETGILFSDKGERTKTMELISTVTIDPALPTNFVKWNYHYYYIDIPIKLNYIIIDKRFQFFISTGISTNFFLYQRTKVSFVGSNESSISISNGGLSRLNLALLIGVGFNYQINDKLKLRTEPIFRHSINPVAEGPLKRYQYSIGCNIGLTYKLQ